MAFQADFRWEVCLFCKMYKKVEKNLDMARLIVV